MKRNRTTHWPHGLLCGISAMLLSGFAAAQDPSSDRQKIETWLKSKYPALAPSAYARGALAFGATDVPQADRSATAAAMGRGKQAWERKFANGRSLASCFPNGGKRVAATYPQVDPRSGQVVTFEGAINRCLIQHKQPELNFTSDRAAAEVLLYARSLADGSLTTVRINGKSASAQYEAGKKLFYARLGSRNQACASCHVQLAGEVLLDRPLTAAIGQSTSWPRLDFAGNFTTLQQQYQLCLRRTGAEPPAIGSAPLNNLEYFHTALSNRLALVSSPK
jgi:L-cysteine S-thiosulfotransferase